jgi:hypothetical protein
MRPIGAQQFQKRENQVTNETDWRPTIPNKRKAGYQ